MEKALHEALKPIVRSFIEDVVFALFHKLGSWLEARVPSLAARVVLGFLLGFAAIASIVMVTGLSGF